MTLTVDGAARLHIIVGDPIAQVKSPAGMDPGDAYPVDVTKLTSDMFVGCVITRPAVSPLIEAAREIGCKTSVGDDMYAAQQKLMLDVLLGYGAGARP